MLAMVGADARVAATALSGALSQHSAVLLCGPVLPTTPDQCHLEDLRVSAGYPEFSQSSSGVGDMIGIGALAGLPAAAVASKPAAKDRTTMRAIGVGINDFGRVGRQVARTAMKDPETEPKLLNASYDADHSECMMECDTVHGKYDGTIVADGDSLAIDGQRVVLSHTCDSADTPLLLPTLPTVFANLPMFS